MITQQEADTIKQILGRNYAKKILDHLLDNEIFRDSGEPYSRQDIYNIMSTDRENEILENAIIELVALTKEKRRKEMAIREAILK
ncbi:hypothetical protein [Allomuricauda sp. ARW1Y1]|jgi:hypothetical protein|uniref:hypothetical protein n=1 Tax=Allomuricauda sp. ARW1Y1 TaxID=2663843 RepID=UPI0015CCF5DF|nr:hypothetical protein [Muricauda sp. ARW1Y1]NYJ27549.1 hypothetical protein [Muricauda sp. ARW1Y1]